MMTPCNERGGQDEAREGGEGGRYLESYKDSEDVGQWEEGLGKHQDPHHPGDPHDNH